VLGKRQAITDQQAAVVIEPVGSVSNKVKKPMTRGWESVDSTIHLRRGLGEALEGLKGHSHLIVVFWMHEVPDSARRRVTHHLHGDESLPIKGDLATRSQNRPNPIGVSVVELKGIEQESIRVRGLDAIDGTPVLDIKPYIPAYDALPDAKVPSWVYGRFDED
jgi:tRNA-Thr(GGU) m(6)t(6)A37 methyltransferase TsaA